MEQDGIAQEEILILLQFAKKFVAMVKLLDLNFAMILINLMMINAIQIALPMLMGGTAQEETYLILQLACQFATMNLKLQVNFVMTGNL